VTEQAPLTLDDVRLRFLDAQAQLADAASAVEVIRESAERLGAAREGLADAGAQVVALAERFGSVADTMAENAERLREGVDAIRLGDPAAIRRQIEELDAAFTALQAVLIERLTRIEAGQSEARVELGASVANAQTATIDRLGAIEAGQLARQARIDASIAALQTVTVDRLSAIESRQEGLGTRIDDLRSNADSQRRERFVIAGILLAAVVIACILILVR
jgi:hypothetical protein